MNVCRQALYLSYGTERLLVVAVHDMVLKLNSESNALYVFVASFQSYLVHLARLFQT